MMVAVLMVQVVASSVGKSLLVTLLASG